MEIDEGQGANANRVYDPDLDGDKENDQFAMNGDEKKEDAKDEKKKIIRKPRNKYDADYMIDNENGLKKLYRQFVIDGDKNLQLKGKGHEISDLNKVMKIYKGWHFEAAPKLEFSYFAERLHKIGNDKAGKAFMSKLRRHYLGDEIIEDLMPTVDNAQTATKSKEDHKAQFEYINTSNGNNQTPFDDYANFCSSKNGGVQMKKDEKPFFRMMDPPIDTSSRATGGSGINFNFPETSH